MDIDAVIHPTDAPALAEAAAIAGYAPSIHEPQPWRWRITGRILDLHLERGRIAPADPDGRLAILSCGAALHHARAALAAQGRHVTVTRMVLGADRDLLARLHVDGRSPVDPGSARLLRTIVARHSDRRPVTGGVLDPAGLTAIMAAGDAYDTRLLRLRSDQILSLAAVAEQAAALVVLYGSADHALNWLRAGEAFAAAWLAATEHDISLLARAGIAGDRSALRAMLPGGGYPYLVLRIDPGAAGPPDATRPPVPQLIERF